MDTSWINMSNISLLPQYALEGYETLIPRDALISFIITVIIVGIYLASDHNTRITFAVLLLIDFFFAIIIPTPIILGFCIVSALIGAYALYQSFME